MLEYMQAFLPCFTNPKKEPFICYLFFKLILSFFFSVGFRVLHHYECHYTVMNWNTVKEISAKQLCIHA